jgi:stress response protein YsnF
MIYAGERPAVVLTKEQIEFLAQINAAVNIDDNYYEDPDNPIYRDLIISYDIPE